MSHANQSKDTLQRHENAANDLGHEDSSFEGASMAPPAFQLKAGTADAPPSPPSDNRSNGLPAQLRAGIEGMSGLDMSDVTVKHNSDKPAQMNAHAYAQGSEIHLGPGQEKHLPHEAWHVVQQKKGQVKPTTEVNGNAVNDDASLEREADTMGAKAMQMKMDDQASPALQMRDSLRTTQLKSAVVQRAVDTHGGEWSTSKYELVTGSRDQRGADIVLDFHPTDPADATSIGLVQTARAINNGSVTYIGDPTREQNGIDGADAVTIDPATGETDQGTHIDQAGHNRNPLYAVEGAPGTDTALTDTPAHANWGEHGWRFTDGSGNLQEHDAQLKDTPQQRNVAKNSKNIFEVSALALSGNQEGTYYGSVQWGWETDSAGNHTKLPLSVVSEGVPSSSFLKAGANWNEGTSSGGDANLELPIHQVFVVQSAVHMTISGSGERISLPEGTRLILRDWQSHMGNFVEVEVGDGPETGRRGTVYQGNLLDERTRSHSPLGPGVPEPGNQGPGNLGGGSVIV